jgi:hypothetical protein
MADPQVVTTLCNNCRIYNQIPNTPLPPGQRYHCGNCGAFLQGPTPSQKGSAGIVGAAGGAAIGAALGGLVGFLFGSTTEGK